jgi:hypothetical protein
MASKRHIRRRACESKIAHKSAAAAYGAALSYSADFCELLRSYRCPWCGRWQIGHSEDNHDNRTLKARS